MQLKVLEIGKQRERIRIRLGTSYSARTAVFSSVSVCLCLSVRPSARLPACLFVSICLSLCLEIVSTKVYVFMNATDRITEHSELFY